MNNLPLVNNLLNSFKAFAGSHFMFNVMNTIQSDLLLNKNKDAFQTLQIFNRLYKYGVRCSNEQCITLEEEIQFLNQYLAMEHIRFEYRKFPKSISCGPLESETLVPTFILQNFVENAILMSMEQKADSTFLIRVEQENDFTYLRITLDTPNNQKKHSKIIQKLQLAEERLSILASENQCEYELNWQNGYFMELKFNFTEN